MARKERGLPVPKRIDQIIFVEVTREKQRGRGICAAARHVAALLNNSRGTYVPDDRASEIGAKMIREAEAGMPSSAMVQIATALLKGEIRQRPKWKWEFVRRRYYKLTDANSPAGRRLREHPTAAVAHWLSER